MGCPNQTVRLQCQLLQLAVGAAGTLPAEELPQLMPADACAGPAQLHRAIPAARSRPMLATGPATAAACLHPMLATGGATAAAPHTSPGLRMRPLASSRYAAQAGGAQGSFGVLG